jgi:hypothetical protein
MPYDNTSLLPGNYIVEVSTTMEPLNVTVNADELAIPQTGTKTWTATLPIVVEVSK